MQLAEFLENQPDFLIKHLIAFSYCSNFVN